MIARKRFGQNFLQDTSVIQSIIQAINPKPDQHLVEIGPGQGALTKPILKILYTQHMNSRQGVSEAGEGVYNEYMTEADAAYNAAENSCAKCMPKLTVIEIDRDLVQVLKTWPFDIDIIEADALTIDFSRFTPPKIRIFGNLPYNISTPLLLRVLFFISSIQDAHFMVQKEVAERITAPPGGKNYGRLSVMTQYFCQADLLFSVGPEAFIPKPKVESSVIRLTPHSSPLYPPISFEKLEAVVKQAFACRRKTLKNNFKNTLSLKDWETLDIDPTLRPEQLDVKKFVSIAQFLL